MAGGAKRDERPDGDLPADLSQPARRALATAGYARLEQFAGVATKDLLRLHGVGPRAIRQIARDLAGRGLSLADGAG